MLVLVLVVLVVVGGIMKPIMTFLRPKRHRWRDERRRRPYAHIAQRRARRRQMYRARSMLLSILILVIITAIDVFFLIIIIVFVIIIAGTTPSSGTQPRRRRRRIGVPVLRLRAAPDRALRLCSGTRGRHGAARAELEVVVPVLLWCGAWGRGDASACLIRV